MSSFIMELLGKREYIKVIEPLAKVTINNLFARSVIEKRVSGTVYVDNRDHPKVCYVVHPYGMSLLFGDCNHKGFNDQFRDYCLHGQFRSGQEWLQAYPGGWDNVLLNLFKGHIIKSTGYNDDGGIIELNTRVNFKFNLDKYLAQKPEIDDKNIKIEPTDKMMFLKMKGSVVPRKFWDNPVDFVKYGKGFTLFYKNELVSTAFSSYVIDNYLELGIETVPQFRGRGFARLVCSALIEYSLNNNYEPVWSCRLENEESYKLAQKLGFQPTIKVPYYRLGNPA